jgi:hypothetical protein
MRKMPRMTTRSTMVRRASLKRGRRRTASLVSLLACAHYLLSMARCAAAMHPARDDGCPSRPRRRMHMPSLHCCAMHPEWRTSTDRPSSPADKAPPKKKLKTAPAPPDTLPKKNGHVAAAEDDEGFDDEEGDEHEPEDEEDEEDAPEDDEEPEEDEEDEVVPVVGKGGIKVSAAAPAEDEGEDDAVAAGGDDDEE